MYFSEEMRKKWGAFMLFLNWMVQRPLQNFLWIYWFCLWAFCRWKFSWEKTRLLKRSNHIVATAETLEPSTNIFTGWRSSQAIGIFKLLLSTLNHPEQPCVFPVFGPRCRFLGPPGITPNPNRDDGAKALSAAALLLSLCRAREEKRSGSCQADHKRLAEPIVALFPLK